MSAVREQQQVFLAHRVRVGAGVPSRGSAGFRRAYTRPVKYGNDSYVRDYSRCILCYKCVEARGEDTQNTFAIAVAGRRLIVKVTSPSAMTSAAVTCA